MMALGFVLFLVGLIWSKSLPSRYHWEKSSTEENVAVSVALIGIGLMAISLTVLFWRTMP